MRLEVRKISRVTITRLVYPYKTTYISIQTKKFGYIVWIRSKKKDEREFYISPNGYPWASTFYLGPNRDCRIKAAIRKELLGHNYDVRANRDLIMAIEKGVYISERWFLDNYAEKNSGSRRR